MSNIERFNRREKKCQEISSRECFFQPPVRVILKTDFLLNEDSLDY